jgi:hypothetical protein
MTDVTGHAFGQEPNVFNEQPCFVEFAATDMTRFGAICAAFAALKHDKQVNSWRDDEDWLELFDDAALSQFWWPTPEEREAWRNRWEAAPVPERLNDPSYTSPSWDFLSMIEAFENGEYGLVACRVVEGTRARLEFDPDAFPYGGTGCFRMLVRAFGFQVTGEDDGTGNQAL